MVGFHQQFLSIQISCVWIVMHQLHLQKQNLHQIKAHLFSKHADVVPLVNVALTHLNFQETNSFQKNVL